MNIRREFLFGMIVMSFFLMIILGVGELYFRLFNPQLPAFLRPDPVVGTMHFSNYTVRQDNACMRATTVFNGEGMNDVDHEIEKPDGVYRIAVIGDSYVEAMQLPLQQSFFKRMEKKLQSEGHVVEVLSFGVGGFGTLQEYYLLRDYALKYKPDLVVLSVFTYNDIRNNSFDLEGSLDMPYAVLNTEDALEFPDFQVRKEYIQTFESPLRTLVFENSHLIRFVYRLSNQSVAFRNFLAFFHLQTPAVQSNDAKRDLSDELYFTDSPKKWKESWAVTDALIKKIHDEASAHDASFLLFSLSNDVQLSDATFFPVEAKYPGVSLDVDFPEKRLSAIADRYDIPYLSALPWMRELAASGVIVHPKCHGHWSAEASGVAGDKLADFVKERFLLERKQDNQ